MTKKSPAKNNAPTDVEPTPPALGPVMVGDVPMEIMNAVTSIKNREVQALQELGRLHIRQHELVNELKRLEGQAQGLLKSESTRLGIPDGAPWQLTPEGQAMVPPQIHEMMQAIQANGG